MPSLDQNNCSYKREADRFVANRNGGSNWAGRWAATTSTNFYQNGSCQKGHQWVRGRSGRQPSLINLDRSDLNITLFEYPLHTGVTMLGTGKQTAQPPDIVLHGSGIAPQHAFIDFQSEEEVTLHPISHNTFLNGRKLSTPTKLSHGNLIGVGDSYFFRYEGPTKDASSFLHESPYAVITRSGGKMMEYSAGDGSSGGGTASTTSTASTPPVSDDQCSIDSGSFKSAESWNKVSKVQESHRAPHKTLSKPNSNFNRSDQGYGPAYNYHNNGNELNSAHDPYYPPVKSSGVYGNGTMGRVGYSSNSEQCAEIPCETLLHIKRKQAEESATVESEQVLQLDEILAMCQEYEEQISKEIRSVSEKSPTQPPPSQPHHVHPHPIYTREYGKQGQGQPQERDVYSSTNGAAESLSSKSHPHSLSCDEHVFPQSITKYPSPYENLNGSEEVQDHHHDPPYPLLQVGSPRLTGGGEGARPSTTNNNNDRNPKDLNSPNITSTPTPTPTKSVSFSNSVKEFGMSTDEDESDWEDADTATATATCITTQVDVHPPTTSPLNQSISHQPQHSVTPTINISSSDDVVNKSQPRITAFLHDDDGGGGGARVAELTRKVREIEEQEMEAIREMEIEKGLLEGEENAMGNQIALDSEELCCLKDRLREIDESNRNWKQDGIERLAELKDKLKGSEGELSRLERIAERFTGTTDEETHLLERLKFQHELVEADRRRFEEGEFHLMEEEINRESQREELSRLIKDKGTLYLVKQLQFQKIKAQHRTSAGEGLKDLETLEKRKQSLIEEIKKVQDVHYTMTTATSTHPSNPRLADSPNTDLAEKLASLKVFIGTPEDEGHIERIKSRSPIDPHMGHGMGQRTTDTLREIERVREFRLNEEGVQMLEQERARVRELQKRVQEAVKEEWEASRKNRNNQCQSLNSVGSEDSGHTVSEPTDSGSGDDTTDKSGAMSTTDGSMTTENGTFSFHESRSQFSSEMCSSFEKSELSVEESSASPTILKLRNKNGIQLKQNRPLTRYLPVRDEENFDLKGHVESSGHQLQLCPHISVNQSSARGSLWKLGSRFHKWNKRWFVFDRERRALLYYYSQKYEKKRKPRGIISFEKIQEVYVDHLQSVKSPAEKSTFCVKTSSRVYYLLSPSAESMRIWIDIIFTGAEGYREFKVGG